MWLIVVLVWLTVWRASRLLVDDLWPPVAWLRQRVWARWPKDTTAVGYLFTCSFCMSVWVGAPIVIATDLIVDDGLPMPALVWASASAVAGYLSVLEPG